MCIFLKKCNGIVSIPVPLPCKTGTIFFLMISLGTLGKQKHFTSN